MTHFASRCGVHDAPRAAACEAALRKMRELCLERVRIAWCDMHGVLRGTVKHLVKRCTVWYDTQ